VAIQRRQQVSPAPFVAMVGTVACFFLYAASGLVAPWWAVVVLLLVWVVLFALNCAWFVRHPRRTLVLPVVAVVVWFGVLLLGARVLGWGA
jgi:hypothetical protein